MEYIRRLEKQLTEAKIELGYYKGFYSGVNTVIAFIQGNEKRIAKFKKLKGKCRAFRKENKGKWRK